MKKRPLESPELTDWQKDAFSAVARAPVGHDVVFSGGAALAAVHLHHRVSADLDFFLEHEVELVSLRPVVRELTAQGITVDLAAVGSRVSLVLSRDGVEFGRVDFAYYPYEPIGRRERWRGLLVDSAIDIAANKVQAVLTRFQPRDFVDLYLLLREGPERDLGRLLDLSRAKFDTGADPLGLAARLLLVHDIEELPMLLRPISLKELVAFFEAAARALVRG